MSTIPSRQAERFTRLATLLLLVVTVVASGLCRADTVASLLGNFTINQYSGLRLADNGIELRYAVVFGQLPALTELHVADTDMTASLRRRSAMLTPSSWRRIRRAVQATVDAPPSRRATRWKTSLPTEQGDSVAAGLRLRRDVPAARRARIARWRLPTGTTRPVRWQEINVEPFAFDRRLDTDAFSTSLTAGLTESLQGMPASGPLVSAPST
jgi:hypothetical protein